MSAGSGGQIAIISVGSLYQAVNSSMVSAANWTNFVSESVEHTIAELEEGAITGYKDAPPSHQGLGSGQGDIQLEPNPNALGHFLRGVFGQSSGSLLTHAGSWGANSGNALNVPAGYVARPVVQHTFVPIQTATHERNYLPVYAAVIYKDVGSAFVFSGGQFNALELQIQAGQLTKATVSGMFREVTRHLRTDSMAALRNPGGKPWVWDMTSIQVGSAGGLAVNQNFESITLKLETPLEGVVLLDGTKRYGEFSVNGFRRVNISGTLSFRNQEEYDAFVAYENRYMRVNLTNNNSQQVLGNPASQYLFGLQLDIPNFKLLTYSVPIGGPNRLTCNYTAKAEFDVTSLYMIQAQLTNTTSAYI